MVTKLLMGCSLLLVCGQGGGTEILRDPTLPDLPKTHTGGKQPGKLELTATLVGTTRAMAVINGKRLYQGDSIDGHRIQQILPGRVVLEKNQRRVSLAVAKRQIKSSVIQESETQ